MHTAPFSSSSRGTSPSKPAVPPCATSPAAELTAEDPLCSQQSHSPQLSEPVSAPSHGLHQDAHPRPPAALPATRMLLHFWGPKPAAEPGQALPAPGVRSEVSPGGDQGPGSPGGGAEATPLLLPGTDALQAAAELCWLRVHPASPAARSRGSAQRERAQPREAGQPGLRHPAGARAQRGPEQEDEQGGDPALRRGVHPRPAGAAGRARRGQRRLPLGRALPRALPALRPRGPRHELHGRIPRLLVLLRRGLLRAAQPRGAGAAGLHQLVLSVEQDSSLA
ncbi:hypothetical protein NDU88_004093 [Pleurodeles waltl]|uniref:Uncharacterized protein n=1 Tax=Pleurodeles waltl TaxID=8319 RepID=A0AAV7SHT3_PLEWA|nr:hypothetical protein NDU88_004093 [Pleurodeles waltl]